VGRRLSADEKRATLERAAKEGLCRWCGLDVKRFSTRRQTFCSDECVQEHLIRSDPAVARKKVYKREKGICQKCGLDCSKWFGEFKRQINRFPWEAREQKAKEYFELFGVPYVPDWKHRSTFWDVDHIVEVVNGGGLCGLDNLQLLCIPCHRAKTVELNKSRGKKNVGRGARGGEGSAGAEVPGGAGQAPAGGGGEPTDPAGVGLLQGDLYGL
jgi:5-methylcytosine-specific restriction endonuclease McrA